jgi:hypothetical protein
LVSLVECFGCGGLDRERGHGARQCGSQHGARVSLVNKDTSGLGA